MSNASTQPEYGKITQLRPGIRRLIAPNPSPMTYWGTNSYLIGSGNVAIIDPGPDSKAHMRAILAALQPGERISHIFVTHAHLDHSPLARPLADATGARVLAYGDALAGRSEVMRSLVARGLTSGGEGVDATFSPDICLKDGEVVRSESWELTALWTPGHFANHMSFDMQGDVFTGDHVMGWASSLVSPPDGDLAAFMASCERLAARDARAYFPGHGAPVDQPAARIDWLINHRQQREAQILAALETSPDQVPGLTRRVYQDTPAALMPAAERNVFAHLIDLHSREMVTAKPSLDIAATFTATITAK